MLAGKRISDRYKIDKLIGGGGMSNVYLAHDMILNRDVAIKILRYDFTNEEELHRRFQREALSATSLTHPNIVSIYDVGEDGDMHYIVMEYIKGKTLKQYIQEFSPLAPARAVHIMKQLTSAMAHAHEHGIIHRDIKPQNILMDEQGNVKITDFGIATTLSATSYTQTNSVIGTVHYLSPEQARGGSASKKSDIYALGIVLYELLTGQLPFSGESAVSIALKHLQAETPSVREFDASIPQAVENIILKATAKDANHRYDSMEEMEADLATALSASRMQELRFTVPVDDEATKVMPIIKEPTKPIGSAEKPVEEKVQEPKLAPVKKPAKKKWPLLLGALVAIILLVVVAINALTPNKVDVPDVKNLPVHEAIAQLEKAGFVIGEQEELNSEDIAAGNIINTEPRAGVERVKKTEIKLLVSIGRETVTLDNYVGKQAEQVKAMLATRFAEVRTNWVFSDAPEGEIIKQEPAMGAEVVASETTIVFEASKGKELTKVASLKGFTAEQRQDYERSSGLKVNVSSEVYSASIPVGSVVTQKPAEGVEVELNSSISVTISKGPEPEPEPEPEPPRVILKNITIPYEPLEEGMEQHIVIYIQDKTHSMVDVYDEFVLTEPKNISIQFEIEPGSKGAFQIVRDNSIIMNEPVLYDQE